MQSGAWCRFHWVHHHVRDDIIRWALEGFGQVGRTIGPQEGSDDTTALDDDVWYGASAVVTEPGASGPATKASKKLAKKTRLRARSRSSIQEAMEHADNAVATAKRNPEIESPPTPQGQLRDKKKRLANTRGA